MRLKQLRGLPVIDPTAARKIGVVIDYQVDPAVGRLAALDVSAGDKGERTAEERVPADRIRRVGRDAVILTGRGGSTTSSLPSINEQWLDMSTLVGLEVMGDDGNRVGHLVDAIFDQDSLVVEAYLLRASWWQKMIGRKDRIQPDKVHACSRELMILTTGRLKEAVASEQSASMPLEVPLKVEDRAAASTYDHVAEREEVTAPST